jgi:hypothetical protein
VNTKKRSYAFNYPAECRRESEHAARERNVLEKIKKDPKKFALANGESILPI